ncbi:hypothetical protein [Methylobacterium sp. Leaf106]|uniref:hypothetical protein n=1 Tax=Methylobacterium sp. Leaf106 TaxID=1736255 RepID=UPI0012E8CE15|nr:hypothetical protein [Methylobacterium sp. Leaf106]
MFGWIKMQAARKVKHAPCPCCHGEAPQKGMQKGFLWLWRDQTGATLGWTGYPEVCLTSGYACEACGETYEVSSNYVPGYGVKDEKGWPLTSAGERMPISGQTPYRERDFMPAQPIPGWA